MNNKRKQIAVCSSSKERRNEGHEHDKRMRVVYEGKSRMSGSTDVVTVVTVVTVFKICQSHDSAEAGGWVNLRKRSQRGMRVKVGRESDNEVGPQVPLGSPRSEA